MTDERLVPLEGILNFRDFGGYATQDGSNVVRGRLFRSANFFRAKPQDWEALSGFKIRVVADLRRPKERFHEPSRWPEHWDVVQLTSDEGPERDAPHMTYLKEADLSSENTHAFMQALYRDLPYEERHIALFRDYFSHVAKTDGGSVVHCAAGKDRTGVLCALMLQALGAPQETVFEDYLATNTAVDLDNIVEGLAKRVAKYRGTAVSAEAVRPMIGVHESFLAAAFAEMGARNGGLDGYLRDVIGLSDEDRAALRRRYLAS